MTRIRVVHECSGFVRIDQPVARFRFFPFLLRSASLDVTVLFANFVGGIAAESLFSRPETALLSRGAGA